MCIAKNSCAAIAINFFNKKKLLLYRGPIKGFVANPETFDILHN